VVVEEVTARIQPGRGEIFISRQWEPSRQIPADLADIPKIPADFASENFLRLWRTLDALHLSRM
jgi:hypothetical protein